MQHCTSSHACRRKRQLQELKTGYISIILPVVAMPASAHHDNYSHAQALLWRSRQQRLAICNPEAPLGTPPGSGCSLHEQDLLLSVLEADAQLHKGSPLGSSGCQPLLWHHHSRLRGRPHTLQLHVMQRNLSASCSHQHIIMQRLSARLIRVCSSALILCPQSAMKYAMRSKA